ncbi:hypothetical protein M8J77_015227 [Diaphorina citri]|nr:hypothetical protein M8J77_015227 [Diaphorina citri]
MKLCLVICLMLGMTNGYPNPQAYNIPRWSHGRSHNGVVHVFFMHQEPLLVRSFIPNTTDEKISFPPMIGTVYNRDSPLPPMKNLYHNLMKYLDNSINAIGDCEKAMNIIERKKSVQPVKHNNESHPSETKVNATEENVSAGELLVIKNGTAGQNIKRTKRYIDTSFNNSGSKASTILPHNIIVKQRQITDEDDIGNFGSSLGKMLTLIDEQLANKTQTILKRIERVAENGDSTAKKENNNSDVKATTFGKENVNKNEEKESYASYVISPEQNINNISNLSEKHILFTTTLPEPIKINSTILSSPQAAGERRTTNKTSETDKVNSSTLPDHMNVKSISVTSTILNSTVPDVPANLESNKTATIIIEYKPIRGPSPIQDNEEDEYEDEDEDKGPRGIIRKVLDTITINPDDMEPQSTQDVITNSDILSALSVPVFLIVMMGFTFYAIHNANNYFMQRLRIYNSRHPVRHRHRPSTDDGPGPETGNPPNMTIPSPDQELIEVEQSNEREQPIDTEPISIEPVRPESSQSSNHIGFIPKSHALRKILSDLKKPVTPKVPNELNVDTDPKEELTKVQGESKVKPITPELGTDFKSKPNTPELPTESTTQPTVPEVLIESNKNHEE